MDYTVHGILQARILEWVAFPFSRGSTQCRDQTEVSHIAGGFFTSRATREAQNRNAKCVYTYNLSASYKQIQQIFLIEYSQLTSQAKWKKTQAGFKVLLYSFTVILNLLLYGTIYRRLVLFQLITKQNTV